MEFEELLIKTITIQGETSNALKALVENTKALNDNFVLHCNSTVEIEKEVKLIKLELIKYLKYSIVIIITILTTLAGVKGLPELFKMV